MFRNLFLNFGTLALNNSKKKLKTIFCAAHNFAMADVEAMVKSFIKIDKIYPINLKPKKISAKNAKKRRFF